MPGFLLIDSDVLIDHLRKEKKALRFLATELDCIGNSFFGDRWLGKAKT
jgi:hypothetical protein